MAKVYKKACLSSSGLNITWIYIQIPFGVVTAPISIYQSLHFNPIKANNIKSKSREARGGLENSACFSRCVESPPIPSPSIKMFYLKIRMTTSISSKARRNQTSILIRGRENHVYVYYILLYKCWKVCLSFKKSCWNNTSSMIVI